MIKHISEFMNFVLGFVLSVTKCIFNIEQSFSDFYCRSFQNKIALKTTAVKQSKLPGL